MKFLRNWYHTSSLKVKWSVGTSAAIFFTFFLFSFSQYHVINKWMLYEEKNNILQALNEITIFVKQAGSLDDNLAENKELQNQIYEKNQIIRILYPNGDEYRVYNADTDTPKYYIPFQPVHQKTVTLLETDNKKIYLGRAPFHINGFTGYIEIIQPLTRYHQMMGSLFFIMSIFGGFAFILSGLFGFLMAKSFLMPLQKLSNTMKKIRKKGFHERMEPSNSKDEMGELTNIFNDMMDQIEHSFNQQKRFVEDASHELRTPVQIMEGHLKLLNRWGKNDPIILDESLQASIQELDRMKKLVQELLELSRAEQIESKGTDSSALLLKTISQVIKNFELIHEDFTFELKVDSDNQDNPIVQISENHLEQILIIILDNAVKYSDQIHKIDICLEEENSMVKVTVRDYGVGIPDEDLSKIFHRFYRVDKARSRARGGNGLGLSIAKQLVEGYTGEIYASSTLGKGTSITFTLPLIENR
ncbi:HAMP domain-containing histidine kinase [Heyndrickxia vini]|uniref:Signal transduction histidine-protein kinase ArlS n=1 Tax=Heyndrickxia vini TaxID=1476025 RepID=A0ABX7E6T1_9BACI|nr:HAMP domain-containing histidine kinase [Heyndrickxia vini]QQZ11147.1 HAMP domain-containing protein [Heyndrickxia vini]